MEQIDKTGRYEFLAEPFHCDFSGRLFMGHLGNHLLNAADFHSTARGFGMQRLLAMQRSWVLSRLAIEMTEMPPMYTRFNVETWVESAMRYFTSRNFAVVGVTDPAPSSLNPPPSSFLAPPSSKIYGYGRSIWAMIDTESRQPTDIFSIDGGAINDWIVSDKDCPIDKGGRVRMGDGAELVRTIGTYYNDVDINGHINSVKYIEHVLDLWPMEWYSSHRLKRFEIAYVAEAHGGDSLYFYREEEPSALDPQSSTLHPQPSTLHTYNVRIVRTDGTECCRSRLVFV